MDFALPKETYYCQCKGCPNGEGSPFEDAPREYWDSKGYSYPKNCQKCRQWKKDQEAIGDLSARCKDCKRVMSTPFRYRWSFHKNEGPFKVPELCKFCEELREKGKKPPVQRLPLQPPAFPQLKREGNFARLPTRQSNLTLPLNTNPASLVYQRLLKKPGGGLETRQEHIEHHIPATLASGKSPTALAWQEQSFQSLLRSASLLANSTNQERQRLYVDRDLRFGGHNPKYVKVTLTGSSHVEVTFLSLKPGPEGHELISTYDNVTVVDVQAKLTSGDWA